MLGLSGAGPCGEMAVASDRGGSSVGSAGAAVSDAAAVSSALGEKSVAAVRPLALVFSVVPEVVPEIPGAWGVAAGSIVAGVTGAATRVSGGCGVSGGLGTVVGTALGEAAAASAAGGADAAATRAVDARASWAWADARGVCCAARTFGSAPTEAAGLVGMAATALGWAETAGNGPTGGFDASPAGSLGPAVGAGFASAAIRVCCI